LTLEAYHADGVHPTSTRASFLALLGMNTHLGFQIARSDAIFSVL
jgi:hypothetical protein